MLASSIILGKSNPFKFEHQFRLGLPKKSNLDKVKDNVFKSLLFKIAE